MLTAGVLAALPELITNLNQNMICYLLQWGLRMGSRNITEQYQYGFWVESLGTAIVLVKTVDDNTELASREQFVEYTKISEHAPEFDDNIDWCETADTILHANPFQLSTPYALAARGWKISFGS